MPRMKYTVGILAIAMLAGAASVFASEPALRIYYQGRENLVLHRLQLDPSSQVVGDPADAQAAVFQGELPEPGPGLDALKARVASGMGLLVVLGDQINPEALRALTDGAVDQTGTVQAPPGATHANSEERLAAIISYVGPKTDPIGAYVSWGSAVRIHDRSLLKIGPNVTSLVATTPGDPVHPGTPILLRTSVGKGTVFVLNVWLAEGDLKEREHSYLRMLQGAHGAENYDFQRFFFFNWLLYATTRESAGMVPVRFGKWIAAPVPGTIAVTLLVSTFGLLFLATLVAFIFARRYSRRHPEELENFYRPVAARLQPESLGAAALPLEGSAVTATHGDPRWEMVGFHRPLSGFFYNYLLNIFFMIPLNLIITFYIDRNFVNPFLEARGAQGAILQLMVFLAPLLDLGTSQAMIKYFAEYRVKEPGRAITYMQFFVWLHLILGLAAIAVLGLIGAIYLPGTNYAYLSWFVVLHTMAVFPSFWPAFASLFRAQQRFDYAQLLIVLFFAMNPVVQMPCSIIGRHWGLMHPVYGEGMGVVIGFGVGGVIGNLLIGLIASLFYHRVGLRLTTLVLAHFDRDTVKKSLVYGLKLTAGTVIPFLTWGIAPVIMGMLLPNFLELNEIWLVVYSLTFAYLETGAYMFLTLMPSISESYSQHMRALTQRYIDQGLRWGLMATLMMGGAYVAFLDPLITGLLPPQFGRAVGVLMLIYIFRFFDFFTRLPDQVFQGVGRSGTFTWSNIIEGVGRVTLMYVFIKHFGFPGLFYAFSAAAVLKAIFGWGVMTAFVIEPVFSLWQTFINPALAGIGNYAILRAIVAAAWRGRGHPLNTALVVAICLVGSLPIYMSLSGLLGWDAAELKEFQDAMDLVPPPLKTLAQWTYAIVAKADSLSPFQNRFPAKLDVAAAIEAQTLTAEKVVLH